MPATTTELTGTIVDGRVELDAPAALPTGTRGRFVPADEDDGFGPPMPDDSGSHEEELEILRQSIADGKAGIGLMPHDQFMAELAAEFGFAYPFRKE